MTTIYTTLPIYDSLIKQDYNRTGCIIPIYTPRHRLPSWQYIHDNVASAVTTVHLFNINGYHSDISTFFPTLSDAVTLSSSIYYKYDGDTLFKPLPYGAYYLKIIHANGDTYYSEWFVVTDIYPKIVTSLANSGVPYDTFTAAGTEVTAAVDAGGADVYALSNKFTVEKGKIIRVKFWLNNLGGQVPTVILEDETASYTLTSASSAGLNEIAFTPTWEGNTYLFFNNDAACNWVTYEVLVTRDYSTDYIKIDFHDTHDLGNIYYQGGFTQSLWLNTRLNTPTHEPVLIGDEKNGIFITEKIVTKFKFRIVTYVGPVFYRALVRLPQHDTITITDEVGFTYSPAVGNLQVNPINWNYFDWGTLEIVFNDDSEWIWTSETNNLT